MLNRILNQGLEQHGRYHHFERFRLEFLDDPQLVTPEAHDFNVQVVVDEFHFLAQGNEGF